MSGVLDASALIAVIRNEPGSEAVKNLLNGAIISSVNLSEVLYKAWDKGASRGFVQWAIGNLPITTVPFDDDQAAIAASIRGKTIQKNISFADRACLALGIARSLPVITSDRDWVDLNIGVEVHLFRGRKSA